MRALFIIAGAVLSALAAWGLLLVAVVFCGPALTILALLALVGLAAWRGRDVGRSTPGRERLP